MSSSSFRRHLSFANVASALALFIAVSGGTAIALKGKNRVNSGDIKNGQVKTRDLGKNAVTGTKANESTFGIVPDATHAENADELDDLPGGAYTIGGGITTAIVGNVENGVTMGQVDLGSATLRIDCEMGGTDVTVRDDTGGTVPTAAIPTDVWVDGTHEALTSDGDVTTAVQPTTPSATSWTVPIQVWTADDVVTDAELSLVFNVTDDLCNVILPLSQTFPIGSPSDASASSARARPPLPTTSGITARRD